ncbi:hypothetical protein C5748_11350 [Phyllobacterium phragmitis]|uniref:Uncharacterized protein n=1 Tax=Phyllobacterium phragmitis TaxID=2670329 RepID=A0A2S9IS13_9HYPH|nr:hypothetical protein C5748_11350 [Phyllobacterium phragmitis]
MKDEQVALHMPRFHPPLACRPSPPQGWRLAIIDDGISPAALTISESGNQSPISTLVGEMAGRPEGGVTKLNLAVCRNNPVLRQ